MFEEDAVAAIPPADIETAGVHVPASDAPKDVNYVQEVVCVLHIEDVQIIINEQLPLFARGLAFEERPDLGERDNRLLLPAELGEDIRITHRLRKDERLEFTPSRLLLDQTIEPALEAIAAVDDLHLGLAEEGRVGRKRSYGHIGLVGIKLEDGAMSPLDSTRPTLTRRSGKVSTDYADVFSDANEVPLVRAGTGVLVGQGLNAELTAVFKSEFELSIRQLFSVVLGDHQLELGRRLHDHKRSRCHKAPPCFFLY